MLPADKLLRRSLILVLLYLIAGAGLRGPAQAQDRGDTAEVTEDIPIDSLMLDVRAGYGPRLACALPIGNSALARGAADGSAMEWQLAYGQSVIPVRVDILHRYPAAFRGRLELLVRNSYASGETDGNPLCTISQEIIVPPSVAQTYFLAPRVCPPLRPGGITHLTLNIYAGTNLKSLQTFQLEPMQLAPWNLYTLWLDGPSANDVLWDTINPGNELDLSLTVLVARHGPARVPDDLLSLEHYIISTPHEDVTRLPGAARDFCFVCADFKQVQGWSAEDQAGLLAFALGSGYLCLYNTAATQTWQGMPLKKGPQNVARGLLLPVDGGFEDARSAMNKWLSGELEELVLLYGGASGEVAPVRDTLPREDWLGNDLDVGSLFGYLGRGVDVLAQGQSREDREKRKEQAPPEPSLAAGGYLNPIWQYRELCRDGAHEPWDYPLYSFDQPVLSGSFSSAANFLPRRTSLSALPKTLVQHLKVQRRWSPALWFALAPIAGLCLLALPQRRKLLPSLASLALLSVLPLALLWYQAPAADQDTVRLSVIDADLRSPVWLERSVAATVSGREGSKLDLPPGALLRRLVQPTGQTWTWTTRHSQAWHDEVSAVEVDAASSLISMGYEAQISPEKGAEKPIGVEVRRVGGQLELHIDTSRLASGASCVLYSPYGWNFIPSGKADFTLRLPDNSMPATPGLYRLSVWESFWRQQGTGWPAQINEESQSSLARLQLALTSGKLGRDELARSAWLGLISPPSQGMRMINSAAGHGTAILLAELPVTNESAQAVSKDVQLRGAATQSSRRFLRLSFTLEPTQ